MEEKVDFHEWGIYVYIKKNQVFVCIPKISEQ